MIRTPTKLRSSASEMLPFFFLDKLKFNRNFTDFQSNFLLITSVENQVNFSLLNKKQIFWFSYTQFSLTMQHFASIKSEQKKSNCFLKFFFFYLLKNQEKNAHLFVNHFIAYFYQTLRIINFENFFLFLLVVFLLFSRHSQAVSQLHH